jgi:hypothetical protein
MNVSAVAMVVVSLASVCGAQQTTGILAMGGETVTASAAHSASREVVSDSGSREFAYNSRDFDNVDDATKIRWSWLPHPYVNVGGNLMPGGYAPLAWSAQGGLELEARDVMALFNGTYDNGHKVDDNTGPNAKGHDRYLHGEAYWRLSALKHPNWFFGGGYRWSQLSTTNYTKGGSRAEFGGGYDLYFDRLGSHPDCIGCWSSWFSGRIKVDWVMAGTDWENGSRGVDFSLILPRPIEKRHVFVSMDFFPFRFHTTVTEPENVQLTAEQRSQHSFSGSYSMGLTYRFW